MAYITATKSVLGFNVYFLFDFYNGMVVMSLSYATSHANDFMGLVFNLHFENNVYLLHDFTNQ
jgi:hypothetical protein